MAIYNLSNEPKKVEGKKGDTKKTVGITLIVLSSVAFVALLTNLLLFIKVFLLGLFGLFSYPLFITSFVIGIAFVNHKKYVMTKKYGIYLLCALFSLLCILHMLFIDKSGTFFEYLGRSYLNGITVGGVVCGLLTAPFIFILNDIAAYIIYSASLVVFAALLADYLYYLNKNVSIKKPVNIIPQKIENSPAILEAKKEKIKQEKVNIVLDNKIKNEPLEDQSKRKLGLIKTNQQQEVVAQKTDKPEIKNLKEFLLTPDTKIDMSKYARVKDEKTKIQQNFETIKNENSNSNLNSGASVTTGVNGLPNKIVHEDLSFNFKPADKTAEVKPFFAPIAEEENKNPKDKPDFASSVLESLIKDASLNVEQQPIKPDSGRRGLRNINFDMPLLKEEKTEKQPEQAEVIKPSKKSIYLAPPLDLLTTKSIDVSEISQDIIFKREQLENALDTFGIPAKVIEVVVGPAVTRYELEMPPGISVKKVLAHSDDIALTLASNGDIRIEAPIPGKSAVGIEVPNDTIATVGMKEILASAEFTSAKSPLAFAMGKDISGKVRICNLQKMPHLLIAGATNSGKSVCLNSLIISLIYRTSPEDVRLILIDPKRVEFTMYNNLPHLLMPNVITESDKALSALNWAVNEMERRYALFQSTKTKNMDEYKQCREVQNGTYEKIPYIVIIIDELADLLLTAKKEVEEKIMRLAQKARAAGIHLILATQRPSVDVITGTIKANFPSRITFALTSFADSKTILDQGGAEKLLGKGDMLYRPSDAAEPKRIQGCYITSKEIDDIVEYVKEKNKDFDFDSQIERQITNPPKPDAIASASGESNDTGFDALMPQALKLVIENGQASISMIQRRFVVGYPRAARIIDQMQEANFISASDGSKPRSVYITMEQFEELFGDDK